MPVKCFCKLLIQLFAVLSITVETTSAQNINYEIAPWYQWKHAATVLTYDDWSVDHVLIAIPELNKRSMQGTFFVNGWAFEMLAKDIIEASSQGHEIANHTDRHLNLVNEGPSVYNQEIIKFQQRLSDALPNDNCETFSYPFGVGAGDDFLSLQIQSILKNTHIGARAVIDRIFGYDFGGSDYYKLPALVVRNNTTVEKINSWNEEAIQKGGLAVIMYHKVDGSEGDLTITEDMYKAHLDAINKVRDQVWLATFKDMIKYHKEANSSSLSLIAQKEGVWELTLTDNLNDNVYNHPLSIKIQQPEGFQVNYVVQGQRLLNFSTQDGEIYFEAIPDSGIITLSNELTTGARKEQFITFDPLEDKKTIDQPFEINASANSGLPVQMSVTSGPAVFENNKVVLTGKAGIVSIKASQTGNIEYTPAQDVIRRFEVLKVNQSIDFDSIGTQTLLDTSILLNASTSSGLPVSFELIDGPATLVGNTVVLLGDTGRVVIKAMQPGDDAYRPALDVAREFTVIKVPQTIEMESVSDLPLTNEPFQIKAASSSGLPVTLEIISGPATLQNDTCVLDGIGGIVTIRAFQAGDNIYQPSDELLQSFEVLKLNQEISISEINNKITLDDPFQISATSSSGLPVSVSVIEGPIILKGDTIVLSRTSGEALLSANQEGNEIYNPAKSVLINFLVNTAPQEITFGEIPNQLLANDSLILKASASSSLPVSFKIVSGPAFIRDSILFYTGFEGKIVVNAIQEGDSTYSPASIAQQAFNVSKTIAVSNLPQIPSNRQHYAVFPNPAYDILIVTNNQSQLKLNSYKIFTLEGKKIKSSNWITQTSDLIIPLENMTPGTYFLQLVDQKSHSYNVLFIKQ